MREIELAEGTEKTAERSWENLEKTGMDFGVFKPVNSLFVVMRSVEKSADERDGEME